MHTLNRLTLATFLFYLGGIAMVQAQSTNLEGTYTGSYSYDANSGGSNAGTSVKTTVKIVQDSGSRRFKGSMAEAYTGFGVPQDGQVLSDLSGSVQIEEGIITVNFIKTYREHDQESPQYEGTYDPETKKLRGTWRFATDPSLHGTFVWEGVEFR
ncbi:MAG: hypothetical protein AAF236_05400 [Verrucomicrobiota bacterium]